MRPYLDHVLSDVEVAEAEAHLAECAECRRRYRYEESLRVYAGKATGLDEPDDPAEGGAGVREPRRPEPSGSSGAAALPVPASDEDA